jgi:aspartate-semialdehyde dehydrogenase
VSTLAIVHPGNLLGKELRETLGRGATGLSWKEVLLLSTAEEEVGTLTEVGGAAAVVQRYEPGSLDDVSVAFFCGPIGANRAPLAELPPEVTAVVLSPDATLADGYPVVAGINSRPSGTGNGGPSVLVSPHPAVILLAHLLQPLAAFAPREAVATVILPVSLYDDPGIEELFEQTRQIVAMTQRRRSAIFGAQLAFNLLPAERAEERAEDIVATLAAVMPAPLPLSVQLVQGGIFHCLALSLHVRCAAAAPSLPAVRRALAASPFVEPAKDPRHLGPIDAAASDKVLVGGTHKDERGVWIWAAMDNLTRGGALNALEIAASVH